LLRYAKCPALDPWLGDDDADEITDCSFPGIDIEFEATPALESVIPLTTFFLTGGW